MDSLPQGRYQISSFTNGRSTEFLVENGEIQQLKIDGKVIPPEQYPEYEDMVENMLGGGSNDNNPSGTILDVFGDFENMEDRGERMERYFEKQGEEWERLGEEMARRFEDMFEFDREDGTLRFEFDTEEDGTFEFNLDSLLQGRTYRLHGVHIDGDTEYDLDELIREKEGKLEDPEREIDELETMIEQMERRKDEMQRKLDTESSNKTGFNYNGFNFETELNELRADGLLPPGIIRSFNFSQKGLKVNGDTVSAKAHDRIMRRYREKVNVGKKFSIELDGLEW